MTSQEQTDTTPETFQIDATTAEFYERRFVPSIFAVWAPVLLDHLGVGPGDDLVDVACGTGIVARTATERVGAGGSVVGVDLNEAMLGVARRVGPGVDWRQGDVAALPLPDDHFDVVTCQMAAMFFPDPVAAFTELGRVSRPTGRVGIVVPAGLDQQSAYRVFVDVAARHAGPEARSLLGAYWSCGDLDRLCGQLADASLEVVERATLVRPARFADLEDFVRTEIDASPLAQRIDEPTAAAIVAEVGAELADLVPGVDSVGVGADAGAGGVEVPLACHLVTARPA